MRKPTKKPKEYCVEIAVVASNYYNVTAASPKQAKAKAQKRFDNGSGSDSYWESADYVESVKVVKTVKEVK